MANDISQKIEKLMGEVKAFSGEGVNPKVRNKVYARLEEAQIWSERLVQINQPTFPLQSSHPSTAGTYSQCTCAAGVISKSCPIHGGSVQ